MKSYVSIAAIGFLLAVTDVIAAFQSMIPHWNGGNAALLPASMASVTDDAAVAPITTGPEGRAALNFEEDLRLTLQIIMDHERRSTTVSKEQFVQQVAAAAALETADAPVDISVPYDAAARLAYAKAGSDRPFDEFKLQYETNAVAEVRARKASSVGAPEVVASFANEKSAPEYDVSVPYDAAAKLAYLKAKSDMPFEEFKLQYEANAVAELQAKKVTSVDTPEAVVAAAKEDPAPAYDVAVPYDAAAKLAFGRLNSIKHKLSYEQFKVQYENNAVTNVILKKNKRMNIE